MIRPAFVAAFNVALALAMSDAADAGASVPARLCVSNASGETYLFVVRAAEAVGGAVGGASDGAVGALDGAARVFRDLAPGETLCLAHPGRGVVAVFESADSLEGCSRLVPAGGGARLTAFGRFDRCAWSDLDD